MAKENKDLKVLNLAHNQLTDQGAASVLMALTKSEIQMGVIKKKVVDPKDAKAPKSASKAQELLKDVQKEEEPEFDSPEKYVSFNWAARLEKL